MADQGSKTGTDAVVAAGLLLLGILLLLIGKGFLEQWESSSARNLALTVEQLLGAAAAAAGACLLLWWFGSLACAAVGLVLERLGNARAAAATRSMSPAFMQRLVVAAVSFQLLSGAGAHAAVPAPGPQWAPTQEQAASVAVTQQHAVSGTFAGGRLSPVTHRQDPAAVGDESLGPQAPAPAPSNSHPGWRPSAPVVDPGLLGGPAVRTGNAVSGGAAGAEPGSVAVLAGDNLWDIVAAHLGPGATDVAIALEWPRWYEANKALIGQDPDVLLPGQVLLPPRA